MERVFCTVKGSYTNLEKVTINRGGVNRLQLKNPCQGCNVRSTENGTSVIEVLSNEFLVDYVLSGELNVTVVAHEDNPSVPQDVKVGEPIVTSCSYGFESS